MDGNNNQENPSRPVLYSEADLKKPTANIDSIPDPKPVNSLHQSFTDSTEGRIMQPSLTGKDMSQTPVEHSQAKPDNPGRRNFLRKMIHTVATAVGIGAGLGATAHAVVNGSEQVMEQNQQIGEEAQKNSQKWEVNHPLIPKK